MANSFMKKDKELKEKNVQSVNKKVEEMTQRALQAQEKKRKEEIEEKDETKEEKVIVQDIKEQETEKQEIVKSEVIEEKKLADNTLNNKEEQRGIPTEEFLNLNIQLDRFAGNNTTVTISEDFYNKIKEIAEIKNLNLNFFVNKLIRVGLDDINNLSVEEVQKYMCYRAKNKSMGYLIDAKMELEFNTYLEKMKIEGYRFSKNNVICALIIKTLGKFHY